MMKFWPSENNIKPICGKKRVPARVRINETNKKFFHSRSRTLTKEVELIYDEWMMGCNVKPINGGADEVSTIYISRVFAPYTVIVFEAYRVDNRMYWAYVGLTRVGVITEKGALKPITLHQSNI